MTSRRLRLYAVNRPEAEISAALGSETDTDVLKAALLGQPPTKPEDIEIFAIQDLEELGLAGYLGEGHGIDAETLAPHRARLAALSGHVMIVHGDQPVDVSPDLTLIADLDRPPVDWQARDIPPPDSARPGGGTAKKPKSDAAMMGRVAMIVLLVIFALTGLMIWIAA